MIVVTVFLLTTTPMKVRWVENRKENCHYVYIPFNLEGIKYLFLRVNPVTSISLFAE